MIWACLKKGHEWLSEKNASDYEVEVVRSRGRPKKTWSKVIEKDCRTWQLCKEDAVECRKLRMLIKAVVCECEWMFIWSQLTWLILYTRPLNGLLMFSRSHMFFHKYLLKYTLLWISGIKILQVIQVTELILAFIDTTTFPAIECYCPLAGTILYCLGSMVWTFYSKW